MTTTAQLDEFKQRYREAGEVARDHDEFLTLIFRSAVEISGRRNPFLHANDCPSHDGDECRCDTAA